MRRDDLNEFFVKTGFNFTWRRLEKRLVKMRKCVKLATEGLETSHRTWRLDSRAIGNLEGAHCYCWVWYAEQAGHWRWLGGVTT